MIGALNGKVKQIEGSKALVNVNGVGYLLELTEADIAALHGKTGDVFFYTHLIVKEDALDLYGFLELDQRNLFRLVITAKGVGPKAGHKIVSKMNAESFCSLILSGDINRLSQIPGIGKKGAQQIILDLKKKISQLALGTKNSGMPASTVYGGVYPEAVSALIALGYGKEISEKSVQSAISQIENSNDVQEVIKTALAVMGG